MLETDLDVSIVLPLDITDTGMLTVTVSNNDPMVALAPSSSSSCRGSWSSPGPPKRRLLRQHHAHLPH
jgi:hypothetical protein